MSKRYLDHPLLRNPAKWLRGAKKRHSEGCYINGYYDVKTLQANPFARASAATRQDVSHKRFPIGNMIQMVVKKQEEKYSIVPVLEKPKKGLNPASYVLNNELYIQFLKLKHFKPIPLKYRHRSLSIPVSISDRFVDEVAELYTEQIRLLLPEARDVNSTDVDGIYVVPSLDTSVLWRGKAPVFPLHTELLNEEIFLPFESNEKLCSAIIALWQYKR